MAPRAKTPKRRIWSYESACAELRAEPFRAEAQHTRDAVWFSETDDLQAATRKLKRGARAGPARVGVKAYPLAGLPGRPNVVAEFAGVLLLERSRGRLVPADGQSRLPYKDRANLQWIYWGDLIASPSGQLALGPLSLGPWPGADAQLEPESTPLQGVTSGLLRAISPDKIIADVVAALETLEEWQHYLADKYNLQAPEQQQRLLAAALARTRRPPEREGRRYTDSHYRDVALLYLALQDQGQQRRILIKLAEQLRVSRETARDWVHRARELGYLTASQHGRPGAQPGHRLTVSDAAETP